jgi:signal transduction histidine kinase
LAQSVSRGGKRVFALLENLLEWSRFQMDRVDIEPAILDLQSTVQASADLLHAVAQEKGLGIVNEVGGIEAYADPQIVETIIRNLISNAIKFTEKSGTVTISANIAGNWVEVTVTDTGIGIPEDKVEILFDLGEKTSTIGTDGETGTGLGLQLCKELVEKHGGVIGVKSTEGKGTSISFTLPVAA